MEKQNTFSEAYVTPALHIKRRCLSYLYIYKIRKFWKYISLTALLGVLVIRHTQCTTKTKESTADQIFIGNGKQFVNTTVLENKTVTKLTNKSQYTHLGSGHFKEFLQVPASKLKDNFLHFQNYQYIINQKSVCSGENILVLIVFHSAPQNINERNKIRMSSGKITEFFNYNLVTVFFLARTRNDSIQKSIFEESKLHKDIIQGDFIDSYRNLTYKNVMVLDWTIKYCNHTKYVLKVDDDVLVSSYHLSRFLINKMKTGKSYNFLYCSVFSNHHPRREKRDKWYTPMEVYPYNTYPLYCEGFAYIMSVDVVEKFYKATTKVPYFWIDDVYVTGFLAYVTGVRHTQLEPSHGYCMMSNKYSNQTVMRSLYFLARYRKQRQYWPVTWEAIQKHQSMWI